MKPMLGIVYGTEGWAIVNSPMNGNNSPMNVKKHVYKVVNGHILPFSILQ
jgi:hypothetical protein